jgi:hypothetical protein
VQESTTYQAILEEGAVLALQKILVRQGEQRFGPASATTRTYIKTIEDLGRLERMTDQLQRAASWSELLAVP